MSGINLAGAAVVPGLIATGVMDAPTSPGEVAVTAVGFEPTIVLFFGSTAASDTPSLPANAESFVGFMTATVQRCWGQNEEYAADPTITERWAVDDAPIRLRSPSGFLEYRATFVSMDADGFTVDFTDEYGFSGNPRIGWCAIRCGVEITTATLPPTAAGTETVALAAAPTAILVFRDELVTDVAGANFSMGWATGIGSDEQGVFAGDSEDGAAGGRNSCDLLRTDRVFAQVTSTDTSDGQWSMTDFGSTLEFTCEENGTADVVIVALRGISATSGVAVADTGATTLEVLTPGVAPHGVMFLSLAKVASTSVRPAERFCLGWGDDLIGDVGLMSGGLQNSDEGAVNIGNYVQARELMLATEVDVGRRGTLGTNGGGFQADGFTVGWRAFSGGGSSAPPIAYEFLWLAFGGPG